MTLDLISLVLTALGLLGLLGAFVRPFVGGTVIVASFWAATLVDLVARDLPYAVADAASCLVGVVIVVQAARREVTR